MRLLRDKTGEWRELENSPNRLKRRASATQRHRHAGHSYGSRLFSMPLSYLRHFPSIQIPHNGRDTCNSHCLRSEDPTRLADAPLGLCQTDNRLPLIDASGSSQMMQATCGFGVVVPSCGAVLVSTCCVWASSITDVGQDDTSGLDPDDVRCGLNALP